MKILLLPILFFLNEICVAQTISFKAHFFYKNELLKNFTVLVDGNESNTNLSGLLTTPILAGKTQIKLQPKDKKYIILYPTGGNVFIPKDNSLVVEIILAGVTDDPNIKLYQQILREINESKNKPSEVLVPLKKRFDILEAQLKKLNYSSEDLRSAQDRQNGIDLFYPEITKSLSNYVMQAINVQSAFKYTADFAFTNSNALQKLVQAITEYNPGFEKINENYSTYAKQIKQNWQSDTLTKVYNLLADYVLNDFHKQTILPFNDIKNNINRYFLGELPGKKNENKKKIQNEIAAALPALSAKLDLLERRVNAFINLLSAY